ncbi:MAG TPA: hypothetical protein VI542_27735 [Candidatus Tectomicrobia bacterium]
MSEEAKPVLQRDARPEDVAAYIAVSFTTVAGIDDALAILNVLKVKPDTPADELRMIEFEFGDQIAKKARVFAQMNVFMANLRVMRPPTDEMIASAKKLAQVLDELIAANVTARQVIVTATQLFKIWQKTEA